MKEGDATSLLYAAHRPALVRYATRILGSREAAEDIVQDAFLRFSPANTYGASAGQTLAYLYRIVRNLCLDLIKRRRIEMREQDSEPPFWSMPRAVETPEETVLVSDEVRAIAEVLDRFPLDVRVALEMHRFGGYTLEEVAAHLGISVATAHRHVRAALVEIALRLGNGAP
ncbi:sigma-70 family RNA polymerase sigma factor [Shinella yambaruensis]|uniref:DNA-directed RNA polymerase sigma-70 factor n=1 Tax=Shinella yambaruensis TaxID=415996 RepID=A0ABQ5ZHH2_9HYPH|nr:sigma-70 family RNA polymerase sigma factor [Shinella yambaruensis]MCJ8025104.1 sigma-70 family RNA polymerase sigma factor [Shinella yambaruensis]MCU7980691.1 sigma-70 family RNA polymerase sigma factor [Shinella yambaruensis]GLR52103.1 DNA-directed RNA polymerase sigma-70 factor [Shinella yambaruensis]